MALRAQMLQQLTLGKNRCRNLYDNSHLSEDYAKLQQQRRVSAPLDAPSDPVKLRRNNRGRNWRLKTRTGESSGSGSASGTTTSDESGNAAHAQPVLSNPHLDSTPLEETQASATTIRFTPGC